MLPSPTTVRKPVSSIVAHHVSWFQLKKVVANLIFSPDIQKNKVHNDGQQSLL